MWTAIIFIMVYEMAVLAGSAFIGWISGMLVDMFSKRCDITIVVSADSDMIPSVEIIKDFAPEHPVHVFVPPTQKSFALASKCDHVVWLGHYRARFVQSMLPDDVKLNNGHVVSRPDNWR